MPNKSYDTIIIGGGPAGISASLYIARAGKSVLLFAKDNGALEKAEKVDNFFGQSEPISGNALIKKGREHAVRLGVFILETEVVAISEEDNVFTVNGSYTAKSVVIATGKSRSKPNIKGLSEFEGKGVSFCAICDGAFFKNKTVIVIGEGEYAKSEAKYLSAISAKIITLSSKEIAEIYGDKRVRGIKLKDGSDITADGIFIAEGSASALNFADKLGIETKDGNIVTDKNGRTGIDGLYACGDCTGGLLQIAKAVGEGAVVGELIVDSVKLKVNVSA
ncbi:thioredoxin reductase [Clostridia bacterium]|nr:thioredoxin reductase [Clostridia bacterium]